MDGDVGRVKKLLSNGVPPSAADSAGYTALHYACRSGHDDVCQLLLSSGAHTNSQTPGGVTPLHRAGYCGHLNIVQLLVQHGADVELVDSDGKTALHKAAERCHYPVAELLVSTCPALVKVKDNRGQVAIDLLRAPSEAWGKLLN